MSDVGGGFSLQSGPQLADAAALEDGKEGWQAAMGLLGDGAPDVTTPGLPQTSTQGAASPAPPGTLMPPTSPAPPGAAPDVATQANQPAFPASLVASAAGQAVAVPDVSLQAAATPPVARASSAASPNAAAAPGRADVLGQPTTIAVNTGQASPVAASSPLPPVTPAASIALAAAALPASPAMASLPPSLQALLAAAGYAKPASSSVPVPPAAQLPAGQLPAGQQSIGRAGAALPGNAAALVVPSPPQAAVRASATALSTPGPASPMPTHAGRDHAQAAPAAQQPGQPAAQPAILADAALAPQGVQIHHPAAPPPLLGAPALAMMLENLPPLRRGRADRERVLRRAPERPKPELWLSSVIAALPDEDYITYTDHRPLVLDLHPVRPDLACWRLDDTETLVRAVEHPAAARRAASLHAALMAGAPPLASLQPGEGFSTWQGSPLWLRLAGVAKPAELGVLLAESRPARVEVTRQGAASWHVAHHRAGRPPPPVLRLNTRADDTALTDAVLYGPPGPHGAGSAQAGQNPGQNSRQNPGQSPGSIARAHLARAAMLAAPHSWRLQEAWCAVLRALRSTQPGEPAHEAALAITAAGAAGPLPVRPVGQAAAAARDSAVMDRRHSEGFDAFAARLHSLGQAVLAKVSGGDVQEVDRMQGLCLAAALGRLAPPHMFIGAK